MRSGGSHLEPRRRQCSCRIQCGSSSSGGQTWTRGVTGGGRISRRHEEITKGEKCPVLSALVARGGDKREEDGGVARRDRGKPIAWHTWLKAQRWRGRAGHGAQRGGAGGPMGEESAWATVVAGCCWAGCSRAGLIAQYPL
jgi:hypothetical protein